MKLIFFIGLLFFTTVIRAETLVLVVDTGINNHQIFNNKIKVFNEKDQDLTNTGLIDIHGHGSNVSGIILKENPSVKIVPFKTLTGTDLIPKGEENKRFVAAIDFAIKHNIKYINFSQTMPLWSDEVLSAIKRADLAGITIVASIGNHPYDLSSILSIYRKEGVNLKERPLSYPCGYKQENVICVGAYIKGGGKRLPVSSFGNTLVDIFAPALGTGPCTSLSECTMEGSSQAAAFITARLTKGSKVEKKKDTTLSSFSKNGYFID